MINKTEQQIMEYWVVKGSPVVSICCVTYNHEKYISEALDSFLMQETDFPFEIIVRDDCSTDKTATIIQTYVEKYPNIIKPIFELENTFSKVGMGASMIVFEKAVGDYIALCDGDDYWTDIFKLKIQIAEMKKKPDCGISFHPATRLLGSEIGETLARHAKENKIFNTKEMILGDGGFCPTASLILKKEVITNLPEWFYNKVPVVDYFLQIFGSLRGGALYIDRNMCIYRSNVGIWSLLLRDYKATKKYLGEQSIACGLLDNFLEKKYSKEFKFIINRNYWETLVDRQLLINDRKKLYAANKSIFSFKQKVLWYSVYSRPLLYDGYRLIKEITTKVSKYI